MKTNFTNKSEKFFTNTRKVVSVILLYALLLNSCVFSDALSPESSFSIDNKINDFSEIKTRLLELSVGDSKLVKQADKILKVVVEWEKLKTDQHTLSLELIDQIQEKERAGNLTLNDILTVHDYYFNENNNHELSVSYYIGFLARLRHSKEPHIAMLSKFLYDFYYDKTKILLNRGYDIPINLNDKTARVLGKTYENGDMILPYSDNFAYIGASLNSNGDVLDYGSTMISFSRRQNLNKFLKDNPEFTGVIDKIYLGSKGDFRNFMGISFLWTGMSKYKND